MNMSQITRFLKFLRFPENSTCWEWTAYKNPRGYGKFFFDPKAKLRGEQYAHIGAYKHWVGEVPEGLELDHLCRNPGCVNPLHLEPVTHHVNMSRGAFALKLVCKNGHERTFDSTRNEATKFPGQFSRRCKQCKYNYDKARLEKIVAGTWVPRQRVSP